MTQGRRVLPGMALIVGMLFLACCSRPIAVLGSPWWNAPPFELTDETGSTYNSASLAGKVWIASFIYTNCPDACPVYIMPKMKELQDALLAQGLVDRVALVSFTVDPLRDTPAVLAEYAARFGTDPRVWRLLTGPNGVVQNMLQRGFKVGAAFAREPGIEATLVPLTDTIAMQALKNYSVIHSERFLLVDRHGKIRTDFDSEAVTVEQMLSSMELLLKER
jgi:protein SCO1